MPVNSFETYPMSWKPAWNKERPLYRSLAQRLEDDIRSGALLPGTKLPPQRELADFLDINVSTVSQAFRICSDKGLLTSVIGSGTFVAYDAMTNLSLAPDGTEPLIELASMMPETIAVDGVVASLQAMLAEEKAPAFFQYGSGRAAWRRLAALDLLRRAGAVGKEGAVAANGGQNAIVASLLALCRPGDRLGVDPLVYSGLKQAARLLGVRLVPVAQERGEMSADGIRYAVQNHQIKGLYVVPDFQNPTAHVMSEQGRRTIAQAAEDEGLFIIEDGVARLMAADPLPTIQSLAPERTFFILSLSKVLLPTLRMAYILCPPAYTDALQGIVQSLHLSQSELLAELTARLLVSGAAEALIAARREGAARRNAIAEEILKGYTLLGSSECLSRWLVLPEGLTGTQAEAEARRRGVAVYGDAHFAVGPASRQHGLRLAVTAPAADDELAEGLRRLKSILDDWHP
ncbi:PLP-dependent aminotransferase family protein [uncultured Megasphaera sp.]|uniref:aminotransferase-like domain-containing protein n=1 Tax=uncultured Megasphaera sp. TaxID=165188 RepID=UPI00262CADB3|nr:PLP-dependent aminotransferase family protein [uncultured Megasphaera sp.]